MCDVASQQPDHRGPVTLDTDFNNLLLTLRSTILLCN